MGLESELHGDKLCPLRREGDGEEEIENERGQMFSSLVEQQFGMYLTEHILVISGHLYHYHSRRKRGCLLSGENVNRANQQCGKSQMNNSTGPGFTICIYHHRHHWK